MPKISITYHPPQRELEQRYSLNLNRSSTYAQNFLELAFFLQASLRDEERTYELTVRKSARCAIGNKGVSVLERIVIQHNTLATINKALATLSNPV